MSGKILIAHTLVLISALQLAVGAPLLAQTASSAPGASASAGVGQIIDITTNQVVENLNLTEGATYVFDFGKAPVMNVEGLFSNRADFYAVSSNPAVQSASINAANIFNQQGALITTMLPPGGLPGFTNLAAQLNLNLTATQNLVNNGAIVSSANLNVTASSIINALPQGMSGYAPVMYAINDLNLQAAAILNQGLITAQSGNLSITTAAMVNGGIIQALAGSLSMQSNASMIQQLASAQLSEAIRSSMGNLSTQNLNINNDGGVIEALRSVIVEDLSTGIGATTLSGGFIGGESIEFRRADGSVDVSVDRLQGPVNITAQSASIAAADAALQLRSATLNGGGTFANSGGDVILDGLSLRSNGGNVSFIAAGSIVGITPEGSTSTLDTTASTEPGDLMLVAGVAGHMGDAATGTTAVPYGAYVIDGPSVGGGSVVLNNVEIDASSMNDRGIGTRITNILMDSMEPGTIFFHSTGVDEGKEGNVKVIAQSGIVNEGTISLNADRIDGALSTIGGDTVAIVDSGDLHIRYIDAAGSVFVTTGNGDIEFSHDAIVRSHGNDVSIISSRSVTVEDAFSSLVTATMEGTVVVQTSGSAPPPPTLLFDLSGRDHGGNLFIVAGFNMNRPVGQEEMKIIGPSVAGGNIELENFKIDTSTVTGQSGDVIMISHGGGVHGGAIILCCNPANPIDTYSIFGTAGNLFMIGHAQGVPLFEAVGLPASSPVISQVVPDVWIDGENIIAARIDTSSVTGTGGVVTIYGSEPVLTEQGGFSPKLDEEGRLVITPDFGHITFGGTIDASGITSDSSIGVIGRYVSIFPADDISSSGDINVYGAEAVVLGVGNYTSGLFLSSENAHDPATFNNLVNPRLLGTAGSIEITGSIVFFDPGPTRLTANGGDISLLSTSYIAQLTDCDGPCTGLSAVARGGNIYVSAQDVINFWLPDTTFAARAAGDRELFIGGGIAITSGVAGAFDLSTLLAAQTLSIQGLGANGEIDTNPLGKNITVSPNPYDTSSWGIFNVLGSANIKMDGAHFNLNHGAILLAAEGQYGSIDFGDRPFISTVAPESGAAIDPIAQNILGSAPSSVSSISTTVIAPQSTVGAGSSNGIIVDSIESPGVLFSGYRDEFAIKAYRKAIYLGFAPPSSYDNASVEPPGAPPSAADPAIITQPNNPSIPPPAIPAPESSDYQPPLWMGDDPSLPLKPANNQNPLQPGNSSEGGNSKPGGEDETGISKFQKQLMALHQQAPNNKIAQDLTKILLKPAPRPYSYSINPFVSADGVPASGPFNWQTRVPYAEVWGRLYPSLNIPPRPSHGVVKVGYLGTDIKIGSPTYGQPRWSTAPDWNARDDAPFLPMESVQLYGYFISRRPLRTTGKFYAFPNSIAVSEPVKVYEYEGTTNFGLGRPSIVQLGYDDVFPGPVAYSGSKWYLKHIPAEIWGPLHIACSYCSAPKPPPAPKVNGATPKPTTPSQPNSGNGPQTPQLPPLPPHLQRLLERQLQRAAMKNSGPSWLDQLAEQNPDVKNYLDNLTDTQKLYLDPDLVEKALLTLAPGLASAADAQGAKLGATGDVLQSLLGSANNKVSNDLVNLQKAQIDLLRSGKGDLAGIAAEIRNADTGYLVLDALGGLRDQQLSLELLFDGALTTGLQIEQQVVSYERNRLRIAQFDLESRQEAARIDNQNALARPISASRDLVNLINTMNPNSLYFLKDPSVSMSDFMDRVNRNQLSIGEMKLFLQNAPFVLAANAGDLSGLFDSQIQGILNDKQAARDALLQKQVGFFQPIGVLVDGTIGSLGRATGALDQNIASIHDILQQRNLQDTQLIFSRIDQYKAALDLSAAAMLSATDSEARTSAMIDYLNAYSQLEAQRQIVSRLLDQSTAIELSRYESYNQLGTQVKDFAIAAVSLTTAAPLLKSDGVFAAIVGSAEVSGGLQAFFSLAEGAARGQSISDILWNTATDFSKGYISGAADMAGLAMGMSFAPQLRPLGPLLGDTLGMGAGFGLSEGFKLIGLTALHGFPTNGNGQLLAPSGTPFNAAFDTSVQNGFLFGAGMHLASAGLGWAGGKLGLTQPSTVPTNEPIIAEVNGRWRPVTERWLDANNALLTYEQAGYAGILKPKGAEGIRINENGMPMLDWFTNWHETAFFDATPLLSWNRQATPLLPWDGQPGVPYAYDGNSTPMLPWNGRSTPLLPWDGQSGVPYAYDGNSTPMLSWNGKSTPLLAWDGNSTPLLTFKQDLPTGHLQLEPWERNGSSAPWVNVVENVLAGFENQQALANSQWRAMELARDYLRNEFPQTADPVVFKPNTAYVNEYGKEIAFGTDMILSTEPGGLTVNALSLTNAERILNLFEFLPSPRRFSTQDRPPDDNGGRNIYSGDIGINQELSSRQLFITTLHEVGHGLIEKASLDLVRAVYNIDAARVAPSLYVDPLILQSRPEFLGNPTASTLGQYNASFTEIGAQSSPVAMALLMSELKGLPIDVSTAIRGVTAQNLDRLKTMQQFQPTVQAFVDQVYLPEFARLQLISGRPYPEVPGEPQIRVLLNPDILPAGSLGVLPQFPRPLPRPSGPPAATSLELLQLYFPGVIENLPQEFLQEFTTDPPGAQQQLQGPTGVNATPSP